MAANSTLVGNTMKVRYKVGVDEEGRDIFKEQSFKNISAEATDDNLIGLSDAVQNLIEFNISTIKKEQSFIITRA